jgi:hypothetical protein
VPPVRRANAPNRGVRERLYADAGCHATPRAQRSISCEYSRSRCRKTGTDYTACADSEVAWGSHDCGAVELLSTQIVRKTGESNSSPTTAHLACNVVVNAFQQYERFAGLATAKFERRCLINRACASTDVWNCACSLKIYDTPLLKSSASRQEKASACNRNGAPPYEHFCDDVVLERGADVNATRTRHLDSLLDDDLLFARREAVTNKVSDGAT